MRFRLTIAVSSTFLVIAFMTIAIAQTRGDKEVRITIKPHQAAFGTSDPLLVDFTITNISDQKVQLLKWSTPFAPILDDFLRLARGDQNIEYVGPLAKRAEPGPGDFITLGPGESQTATIDLAQLYAVYEAGPYSVAYAPPSDMLVSVPVDANEAPLIRPEDILSNGASFQVVAARVPPPELARDVSEESAFEQCSPEQKTELTAALPEATKIAQAASEALSDAPAAQRPAAVRYSTWFGSYDEGRYANIGDHFEKILDALANKKISFGCKGDRCADGVFAYVFPNQPYRIYVCDAFWQAGISGTDSRSGTIVHETSHFAVVAKTGDVVYGQLGAKKLAVTSPEKAIANADSHEYFAENKPKLGM